MIQCETYLQYIISHHFTTEVCAETKRKYSSTRRFNNSLLIVSLWMVSSHKLLRHTHRRYGQSRLVHKRCSIVSFAFRDILQSKNTISININVHSVWLQLTFNEITQFGASTYDEFKSLTVVTSHNCKEMINTT